MSELFDTLIVYMDKTTIVFSFGALFFTFINWKNDKKQLQKVGIYFKIKSGDKEIPIDTNLSRKDCQRSEIQGILRTKLIKEKNFYNIDYLSTSQYVENIFKIQNSQIPDNKLIIYLEDDELTQFGL